MICILHGWLLEGSGSNLWTRSVITALARAGQTVHLVCQENHPDLYPAIAEAWSYDANGDRHLIMKRDVPYKGRCILHQPWIGDPLPVFVWDKYEQYQHVVPMIEMSDEELEAYIQRNVDVVSRIVHDHPISAIHANHAVLMSVVAQRVSRATAVPFAIMPHGSGIEYAVKKDERFARYASSALEDAIAVFVIGSEMRQRVNSIFASVRGIDEKCIELHLGVDTSQFDPAERFERRRQIGLLFSRLNGAPRGKTAQQRSRMLSGLSDEISISDTKTLFRSETYDGKTPDADVEDKLDTIDWDHDPTLLFTGRLISAKGIQSVIAALPLLLHEVPELRLILVGHGPLREPMEALVAAFERGDRVLASKIVKWGRALEGDLEGEGEETELSDVSHYWNDLESRGALDEYFAMAKRNVRSDRVLFTGYLTHDQLRFLFPCCDVGVFPSVVREAGPLVFLEALASGCFSLGTYFGGMAASINAVSEVLPAESGDVMKLDPGNTVADIASKVPKALNLAPAHKDVLAGFARERYDWATVAAKMIEVLESRPEVS
ncbi:MAG: glycosyltransferase family 4 protein [Gemmatimonadaceae bacterium]